MSVDAQYVSISVYSPLSGSTYIGYCTWKVWLILKTMTIVCFWYHIRHLNPLKTHPEWITKADKKIINDLDYEDIEFPVSKTNSSKIEKKNNICINVFCY